jgi:hypothetical protein
METEPASIIAVTLTFKLTEVSEMLLPRCLQGWRGHPGSSSMNAYEMVSQTETTGGMNNAAAWKREGAFHMRVHSALSDLTTPSIGT